MRKNEESKKDNIDYKLVQTISKVEELKRITDNFKLSKIQYNSITRI